MKEIEDLEKKMDTTPEAGAQATPEPEKKTTPVQATAPKETVAPRPAPTHVAKVVERVSETHGDDEDEDEDEQDAGRHNARTENDDAATPDFGSVSKVVPMRPSLVDSLAESDAMPARDEPLVRSSAVPDEGGLSLKIGGCADVNLEFARAGISVTLACTEDGLTITTNQGAEFRIPFKRTA